MAINYNLWPWVSKSAIAHLRIGTCKPVFEALLRPASRSDPPGSRAWQTMIGIEPRRHAACSEAAFRASISEPAYRAPVKISLEVGTNEGELT